MVTIPFSSFPRPVVMPPSTNCVNPFENLQLAEVPMEAVTRGS
jgi:hypothetical protein